MDSSSADKHHEAGGDRIAARRRKTLSGTPGQWANVGALSYAYQWQRCGGTPQNVALEKPAYASREWQPGYEASEAVDGSQWTYWSAGDYAPQWIEVDLEAPYPLSMIRASITQLPDGVTTHRFLTAGPNPLDEFQLLTTFSGFTVDQQVLEQPGPPDEVEFIRVETTASPSWVAWREIEALSGCADITGATGTSYTLTPANIGSTVRTVVTATNSTGPTAAASAATPDDYSSRTDQPCDRDNFRHSETPRAAFGDDGHLAGVGADLIRVPVAEVQQRGDELREPSARDRGGLRRSAR